jgi:putative endonuclease
LKIVQTDARLLRLHPGHYSGTLYVGVTNNLERRLAEHRAKVGAGFTKKYNVTSLVYYEHTNRITDAIAREKEIKAWRRDKNLVLIRSLNPEWSDLSAGWDLPDLEPLAREDAHSQSGREIPRFARNDK